MTMTKTMKQALILYHGGKFRIADKIIRLFPKHSLYIEPFGGAASVLLKKAPAKTEVYNDLCGDLPRLFNIIRSNGDELKELLFYTIYSRDELDLCYDPAEDDLEWARRFIVRTHLAVSTTSLNEKTGFRRSINSIDHCSQAQTFMNVHEMIPFVRHRLRNVIIENTDFKKLLTYYDKPGHLYYLDPPYVDSTRSKSSIRRGYKENLSIEDHHLLLQWALNAKAMVCISGYANDLYDDLLQSWRRFEFDSMTDARIKRTEVVWINYYDQLETPLFAST